MSPSAACAPLAFAGDSRASQLPVVPKSSIKPRPFGNLGQIISWQFATLGAALMMLLLGIVAVVVAPKPMSRIANAAAKEPALSFGAGLLTFIVGILAGVLLLIACCLGVFVWLALLIPSRSAGSLSACGLVNVCWLPSRCATPRRSSRLPWALS